MSGHFTQIPTVITYGGRFHPPHPGHAWVAREIKSITGEKVRVVSSDKMGPDSPLSFDDKMFIWNRMFDIQLEYSKNPAFAPAEIVPSDHVHIMVCGQKDIERYQNSKYFEEFNYTVSNKPSSEIRYYLSISTINVQKYNGTYLRQNLKYNKELFIDVYGKFDQEVYDLINERL